MAGGPPPLPPQAPRRAAPGTSAGGPPLPPLPPGPSADTYSRSAPGSWPARPPFAHGRLALASCFEKPAATALPASRRILQSCARDGCYWLLPSSQRALSQKPVRCDFTKAVFCLLQGRIELNAGDILVFRGDLRHSGAAYEQWNTRLHIYVDGPCTQNLNTHKSPEGELNAGLIDLQKKKTRRTR